MPKRMSCQQKTPLAQRVARACAELTEPKAMRSTTDEKRIGKVTAEAPVFELLEPRVLYSADAAGVAAAFLPDDQEHRSTDYVATVHDPFDHDELPGTDTVDDESSATTLVFIDSRVDDSDTFVDAWADQNVHFVIIDADDDALSVISDTLAEWDKNNDSVQTVRLVSHGSSGTLQLGDADINSHYLDQHESTVRNWQNHLALDAQIQLFGCNVAEGVDGHNFLQQLAELTHSVVSGSDDLTGHANAGGDWFLEVSYSHNGEHQYDDSRNRFDTNTILANWTRTLDTIQVSYRADDVTFANNIVISDLSGMADVSLRAAITAANNTNGDDIIELVGNFGDFILGDQSIDVGSDVNDGSLLITNKSGVDLFIKHDLNENGARLFTVDHDELIIDGDPNNFNVTISLEDGRPFNVGGGAIYTDTGTELTLRHVRFEDNAPAFGSIPLPGGAIYANGDVTISDTTFSNNQGLTGGAIYIREADNLIISNSTFVGNTSESPITGSPGGGAIHADVTTTISDSVFLNNTADGYGGAIYTNEVISVTNSQFDGNSSNEGGAIYGEENVTVADSFFANHTDGGAIRSLVDINVSNSEFRFNTDAPTQSTGGALQGMNITVSHSLFFGNTADLYGGAIAAEVMYTVSNSHFEQNESTNSAGGALFSRHGGTVINSSFVDNHALGGSAIHNEIDGTVRIERSTFSGNTAETSTVGVRGDTALVVKASTFVDNTANSQSAGLLAESGVGSYFTSSVFVNNKLADGSTLHALNVSSAGFNLFDQSTLLHEQDLVEAGLTLGPLSTIPDSYVQARALPATSLGIDAGAIITDDDDADGITQPVDTHGQRLDGLPDIGALEVQSTSGVVFWADTDGKIWRSNPEFSNVNLVVDTAAEFGAAHTISGISVDLNGPANNGTATIYWVDHATGSVWQSAADGQDTTQVAVSAVDVNGNPFDATAITLDADRNILYLLHGRTAGHTPAIRAWQLSDTGAAYLSTFESPGGEALENPNDIHFNAATGRLFWVDGVTPAQSAANQTIADTGSNEHGSVTPIFASVKSMSVDGTDVQTHITDTFANREYIGITTNQAGDVIYFTEAVGDRVHAFDLNTGLKEDETPWVLDEPGSVEDITYLSNNDSSVFISSEVDALFTFDSDLQETQPRYDHPSAMTVVTSVTTPDTSKPYLEPNAFAYTEGDPAKSITVTDLGIQNPVAFNDSDMTFELLSLPTLGGTLAADGFALGVGSTFSLSQDITYFNDNVSNQTVDVFQLRVTNASGDVSPAASFMVNIDPIDDPATMTISPVSVNENAISVPLTETGFVINDEENGQPVRYTFTPPAVTNGLKILVNGVVPTGNSFTHTELTSGAVTISAEDTIITPADASTPISYLFDFVVHLDNNGTLSDSQPAQLTVVVTPQDDAAVITLTPDTITINEGDVWVPDNSNFTFSDEESAEPLYFVIENAPDSTIAGLELNGVRLNTGDTFTVNDVQSNNLVISSQNTDITAPSEATVITFKAVTDDTNPASDSNTLSLTVNVLAQNDKPQATANDVTVDENNQRVLAATDLTYSDEEGDALLHYELLGIYDRGTVVPTDQVILLNNGTRITNGDTFNATDLSSGLVAIDARDAEITDTSTLTIDVLVKAVADTGTSDSDPVVLRVDVTPQNDIPRVTPMDQTVQENALTAIPSTTLGYSDEESDAATHYTLLSIPTDFGIVFSLNGVPLTDGDQVTTEDVSTGRFVIDTTQADVQSGATVSLDYSVTTVDGQESLPASLNFKVLSVNDAATLSTPPTPLSIDEGALQTLSTAHIIFSDEENNQPTRYVLQSLPTEPGVTVELNGVALSVNDNFTQAELTAGLVTINATQAPVLQSASDGLTLFAEVDDGTVTNSATLAIQFNKVEDAPTLTTSGSVIVVENQSTVLQASQLTFADADGDAIAYYRIDSPILTDGFSVQRDGEDLTVGDTFTQEELDNGNIRIVSDGTDLDTSQSESLFIRAFADNNIASNAAPLSVQLQPEDDAPVLTSPDGVRAFENFVTPVLSSALNVSDEEGNPPTTYTVLTSLPDSVGQLVLLGEAMSTGDTFTQADLDAGSVRIDLEDLDITEAMTAEIVLEVEAGGLSSAPHTVEVSIAPMNDAPLLTNPITLTTISQDLPATLPPQAFTDSDGDNITYSAGIVNEGTSTVEPLPAWVSFDPSTGEFQLLDYARQEELTVQVMADDSNGGRTPTNVVLRFDNSSALGAALPNANDETTQPANLSESVSNGPGTTDETPPAAAATPSEQPAGTEVDEQNAEPRDVDAFIDNRIPTDDIQSSRIDLASLLPAISNIDAVEAQEFNRTEILDTDLAQVLGFTTDINNPLSFTLNTYESSTYQRALTTLANQWDREEEESDSPLLKIDTTFGNSVGLSSGFTVGYMIWLLRGGTLMGSMLTSLPAWRLVDPLPVLAELDDDLDDDQESLESMVTDSEPAEPVTSDAESNHDSPR